MSPIDCTMIVEVNYYPDTSFLDEPLKIVFARDNDGLHFIGAFFEIINDEEQCYALRIPRAIDDLPDDRSPQRLPNGSIRPVHPRV
jgi:hypothetical protein